jgi:hypothetical protein
MKRLRALLIVAGALLLSGIVHGQTDSTVKVRHTMTLIPPRPNEENPTITRTIYYLHAAMRRIDTLDADGRIIFTKINNCESRSGIIVDQSSRQYRNLKLPQLWNEQQLREYIGNHPSDAVRIESRTVDTGEKKVIFGSIARRFITTIERPTKNGISGSETVDGWYVEHEQLECRGSGALPLGLTELGGAILVTFPEIADPHHTGPIPPLLPVQVTYTIKWTGGKYGANGQIMKSERIVESISDSSLDPKTFEIPRGFRENSGLLR